MTASQVRSTSFERKWWPSTAQTVPIVLYDEFLVAEELKGLLGYSFANTSRFVQSEVMHYDGGSEQNNQFRRSRVLFELGPFVSLFEKRLLRYLPQVLFGLRMPAF